MDELGAQYWGGVSPPAWHDAGGRAYARANGGLEYHTIARNHALAPDNHIHYDPTRGLLLGAVPLLWSPAELGSNLAVWLRTDRGLLEAAGSVFQWNNQGSLGSSFAASGNPQVSESYRRPAVSCDGTGDFLTWSGTPTLSSRLTSLSGSFEIWLACRPTVGGDLERVFGSAAEEGVILSTVSSVWSAAVWNDASGGYYSFNLGPVEVGKTNVLRFVHEFGVGVRGSVNGTTLVADTSSTGSLPTPTVAARIGSGASGVDFIGDIGDVVINYALLTDSEANLMEHYMQYSLRDYL